MISKVGPIQTGEEKPVSFPFVDEGISGSIVSAVVTIALEAGTDPDFADVKVGSPVIDGTNVYQQVVYQQPDAVYLLQCTATDTAGNDHTISVYLTSKAAA